MTTADKDFGASCEAHLEGLHSLTNAGIFSTDAHLRITSWNYWLQTNSGRTSQQVLGRRLFDVFPEIADRGLSAFYAQALRGQVVVLSQALHEYLIRMPSSDESQRISEMPQSARIAPLMDDGMIVGTLTMIEDVTERVMREAELAIIARQQAATADLSREALASRDLQRLFQQAVTIMSETLGVAHCAIFDLNSAVACLKASSSWPDKHGTPVEPLEPALNAEFLASFDTPLIVGNGATEGRFTVPAALRQSGIVRGIIVPIVCSGRACALIAVYMTHPWNQSAESLDFLQAAANTLGTAMERDSLESDLRDRAHQLTIADRRKNEFLAMLAHELRNPLAPIRSAAQLLVTKATADDDIRIVCDVLERQVGQMTRLVDDLLDISRITRGKIDLQLENIDLAAVITQAVENSQPQIDAHRHQLTVSVPPQPMPIRADATRIAQAISNLINNAAKYTDPGGQISVAAEQNGDEYIVRVRDNGIGISAEMLPHVFDLFTQVDHSLARSEGGLGIGLTLVRSLSELHGGSVEAFSAGSNQGSEFVIRLPASPAQREVHHSAGRSTHSQNRTSARRVLIVDDNRDAADTLTRLIRVLGHESRSVHDGLEALAEVKGYSPDLVFLDIGLPHMDGFEVARQLREEHGSSLVLVALSGYAAQTTSVADGGFDLHIVKPIDLPTLRAILAEHLPR